MQAKNRYISAIKQTCDLRRLLLAYGGATALEFAFILPILATATFGVAELSLIMFDYHRLSEATRRGARVAVVNTPIASLVNLTTNTIVCQGTAGGVTCAGGAVASGTSFDAVVGQMQAVIAELSAENVQITYTDTGITGGVETPGVVTPIISVEIVGFDHQYLFLQTLPGVPASFTFPPFTSTRVGTSQNAS